MSLAKPLLFAVIMVAMHALPAARAATPTVPEAEINYLLEFIEQSGCDFYRNGTWYDAQQAQAHLRAKYNALAARNEIKTAEDFIEKAASESSLSGRPYQIRCGGSAAIPTGQWLSAALAQYRKYREQISLRTLPSASCARTAHSHYFTSIVESNREIVVDRLHVLRMARKGHGLRDGLLAPRGAG